MRIFEHTTHFNSFKTVALFWLAHGGEKIGGGGGGGAIFQRCAINMLGVRSWLTPQLYVCGILMM